MLRHETAIRWVLVALGVVNVVTGLALLLLPNQFYANVAPYSPYNRHFLGDAGAFVLALGVGLLWAARQPGRERGIIAVAALGSTLHAANHVLDDVLGVDASLARLLTNTVPLAAQALMLWWVWWAARPATTTPRTK